MSYPNYANYLVNNKFQGDAEFAMKYQTNKCELALKDPDTFERECEVLQCMEVIKASKK
jgi:hypothetical protein